LRDTSDDDLAVHEEIYTLPPSRKGFITGGFGHSITYMVSGGADR
jgi:hypothetical protein